MESLRFDFNGMLDFNVGRKHGVTREDLDQIAPAARSAIEHLNNLADSGNRTTLGLEWTHLPYQDAGTIRETAGLAEDIAAQYDNVLFLGIGGSYLGLKAAQDALCSPYYNEFTSLRRGRPRVYFEGNNLDPLTLRALLTSLDPTRTFVVVISKSGETTETKVALDVVQPWLRQAVGNRNGRHILAITDPDSGALRKLVEEEHGNDAMSFRSLPLMKGVGGRYSELNMGLLHMAIVGVDIREVLNGAAAAAQRCRSGSLPENPALMYAAIHFLLYRRKGKSVAVLMPFSEGLKSTADWYVQLLAESLGKKYARAIETAADGMETWRQNREKPVNVGRTPVSCRGTNDLHSIQQNNVEGENNKAVTFIRVEKFTEDITVPDTGDFLAGRRYSELLNLAQEATEWAMIREERPNCTIALPDLSPASWGALIFFFEMATAVEGELLNVNAFDQPGVEGYKNYMYYRLNKPGVGRDIKEEVSGHPVTKKQEFIL